MRKNVARLIVVGAALALATAGIALAAGAVTVRTSSSETLGKILVDQSGKTLYHYTPDKGTTVKCTGACARAWPPVVVAAGKLPKAGTGVSATKLKTVKRPDGKLQVTYAGLTLYRYAGDKAAGATKGQASGKVWYVVSGSGKLVKTTPPASTGGGTGGGTDGGGSTGGGGDTGGGTGGVDPY
jgi:predicted lipoprotein with Yx(FWY)xxD motif